MDRKIHLLEKTINRYFQEIERPLFELREGDGGETVMYFFNKNYWCEKGRGVLKYFHEQSIKTPGTVEIV